MIKNFSVLDDSQIQECLNNKSLKIGIVGIGRIGLPTALSFANSGFETIGIDINKELVDMVNSGNYPLKDEPEFDKIFENVYNNKKITIKTNVKLYNFLNTIRKSNLLGLSKKIKVPHVGWNQCAIVKKTKLNKRNSQKVFRFFLDRAFSLRFKNI